MTPCRKCRWALMASRAIVFTVLAATLAGWTGNHFHRVRGKWVFLDKNSVRR